MRSSIAGGLPVPFEEGPTEPVRQRLLERGKGDDPGQRGEPAEQDHVGHRPSDPLHRYLCRGDRDHAHTADGHRPPVGGKFTVDQHAAAVGQPRQDLGQSQE